MLQETSQEKLLISVKDYELQAIERTKEFKISTQDPLINPPKKKATKKIPIGFVAQKVTPSSQALDPLARMNKINKSSMKSKDLSANAQAEGGTEEEQTNERTSWATILDYFLKSYDYRMEQHEPKLTNVFGSEGAKEEEELQNRINGTAYKESTASKKKIVGQEEPKKEVKMICISTYLKILTRSKEKFEDKWREQDKVSCIAITNQSLKLLHDTSNAKFQAVKFAHIMEIVESFGILVFERIKSLSFPNLTKERLSEISIQDLEGANIPESAQEICKNWINKISPIRELIPRVFVEATLLRLHFFIDGGANARNVLKRLAKSNRCFGEFINVNTSLFECILFSTFLIRIGKEVLPQEKDFILDILDDVFFYIKQGKTKLHREDIGYDEFFSIIEPFFILSFESLSESLSKEKFKRFCQILPQNPHPIILKNFILSFSPSLLMSYSVDIVKILQKIFSEQKYQIYKLLLNRLSGVVFPQSGEFIVLVWTDMSEVKNLEILLDVLGPFSEIIFKNLPRYEKNRFYSLILESFNNLFFNFRSVEKKIYQSFQKFLIGILEKTEDMKDILSLEPFLQIISYFPIKNKREVSESISRTFLSRDEKITDPVIVHIFLSLMKSMEGMNVKDIALDFTSKVDFSGDFEQTLNFLAEMRAIFGYIPEVVTSLIYKAVNLTFVARKNAKGRITKKLVSFLQATLAYCFITVPVLEDPKLKLKLYLYLSEIALANNLISQATSLIKTCITQLAETEFESDTETYKIFHRIISFFIVMPDDPESDYLLLFNGLYQAFGVAKLKTNLEHIIRFQFLTQCIVYISCQAQEKLPFHIEGVVSNDGLFKSLEFKMAITEKLMELFGDLENSIKKLEKVEGPEIDTYVLKNLIECVLTLTTYFETTSRFNKLIKDLCKIIDKMRDKTFKDIRHKNKFTPALKGLINRLQERQIEVKINL